MTLPAPTVCRWCIALAVGVARGRAHATLKPTGPVPYCDAHWDNAYDTVRRYPDRDWQGVDQPEGLF
jgi:hypothetical protein